MRRLTIVFVSCALGWACSDSEPTSSNGSKVGQNDTGNEKDKGGAEPGENATGGDKTGSSPQANTAALDIVLNEVAAVGSTEWIELANKGSNAVDLGNHFVADSEKTSNQPKKSDAMRFPAGTTLQPGQRILIMTSKSQGTVGPHPKADCLADGPDTCFYTSFGVSATNGEAIHVLAPDGSIVTSTATPKTLSADAGGSTNETQCRLPDLTGDFGKCAPTPGQANRAP